MSSNHKSKNAFSGSADKPALRIELTPWTMVVAALVIGGAWMLIRLLPVLLVLIAALMIVGTLNPAVQWLEERGVRRNAGIAMVFGGLLIVIVLILVFTVPAFLAQAKSLLEQEPVLRARLADFLAGFPFVESVASSLRNFKYDALLRSSAATVFAFSTRVLEILAYSAAAFFLAFYIMIDRDRLRGALFAAVPRDQHIRLSRILLKLQIIVGGYIRGQVVTCAFMGVFMFILLSACGIPNAVAISVFGGIADVLPFIGIFLTMGPAVVAALLAKGSAIAAIVFVLMLCYEEFESRVLVPLVYGRALRLPSSVVLFSLIVGGSLMGIVGALLALPVAATILMLIDELRVELPGEEEQTEDIQLKKEDESSKKEYEQLTEGMSAEQAAAVAVEIADDRKKEKDESGKGKI